jgi:hypothetical protein
MIFWSLMMSPASCSTSRLFQNCRIRHLKVALRWAHVSVGTTALLFRRRRVFQASMPTAPSAAKRLPEHYLTQMLLPQLISIRTCTIDSNGRRPPDSRSADSFAPVNTSDASNTSYRKLGNARNLSSQCLETSYYLRCGVASGIRPEWSLHAQVTRGSGTAYVKRDRDGLLSCS